MLLKADLPVPRRVDDPTEVGLCLFLIVVLTSRVV